MYKSILAISIFLGGCTAQQQALEIQAKQNLQAVHDAELKAAVDVTCGTPYSAILRNVQAYPNLWAAMIKLCGAPPAAQ